MPKSKSTKKSKIRHQPLGQVITEDLKSSKYAKTKIKSSQPSSGNESDDDNDDDGYMDEKTSARIYNMSREQQEEEEARAGNKGREAVFEDVEGKGWKKGGGRRKKYEDDDSSDEEEEVEEVRLDEERSDEMTTLPQATENRTHSYLRARRPPSPTTSKILNRCPNPFDDSLRSSED